MPKRKHKPAGDTSIGHRDRKILLAKSAGNECVSGTPGPTRSPRQVDFCGTNLGRCHIEALAGREAFRLTYCVSRGNAVGRTVRRQLAFLMTTDGACRWNASHCIGSISGAFDRRFRSVARSAAETFDPLTRVLERRAHVCGLLLKPTADGCEKAFALLRFLIRSGLFLRDGQRRYQHQSGCKQKSECKRSRARIGMKGQSPFDAHDCRKPAPGRPPNGGLPFPPFGFRADRWRN